MKVWQSSSGDRPFVSSVHKEPLSFPRQLFDTAYPTGSFHCVETLEGLRDATEVCPLYSILGRGQHNGRNLSLWIDGSSEEEAEDGLTEEMAVKTKKAR